jgi:hypothetical protein
MDCVPIPIDRFLDFSSDCKTANMKQQVEVHFKIFDTTAHHADCYGLKGQNPLFVQILSANANQEGIVFTNDFFQVVNESAKDNQHDLIFGHIQVNSKSKIDDIKTLLEKDGYSTIEGNNDFYKQVQ